MNGSPKSGLSRRELMKKSGQVAAASALAGVILPQVHAGENNTIQLALVGCGGRGTGAAANALASPNGPTRLVAMADVFANKLTSSHEHVHRAHPRSVEVPDNRRFIGFDGYRKAMDCLRPGDVVILATPPAFRWVHFTYAIEKRLNVFMEKPITVDGPSTRKMVRLGEESERAGLKVGVGLMCRHCDARKELFTRIREGQMGDITLLRAYRMAGPTATAFSLPKPDNISELLYQIQRFHSFLWASGGAYSDFLIHNIDECCWMKDAWPVSAKSSGGRHYRGNYIDQNFDNYSTEFTFADGTKFYLEGRTMAGCNNEFASYAHGTRGSAIISSNGHAPSRCRIFRGQNQSNAADMVWHWGDPRREPDPYQLEWNDLFLAIRQNRPYNEVRRGAEASLITAMGRMSAHTGQIVTRDQMFNHEQELAPERGSTYDGFAGAAACGRGRQIPDPATGHRDPARILMESSLPLARRFVSLSQSLQARNEPTGFFYSACSSRNASSSCSKWSASIWAASIRASRATSGSGLFCRGNVASSRVLKNRSRSCCSSWDSAMTRPPGLTAIRCVSPIALLSRIFVVAHKFVVGLFLVMLPPHLGAAEIPQPTLDPPVRTVDLNVGESQHVKLSNGQSVTVKLLDLREIRDELRNAVRLAEVKVEVDGQTVRLVSANYRLPTTSAGVQIDCPITRGYRLAAVKGVAGENPWGLDKDVRLRLWPAQQPLLNPGTFLYPAKQRWFASATQMANEPVYVDGGENPLVRKIYYHYGLDIGGTEGMVEVVAATDGLVVSSGKAVLPGTRDSPVAPRYDVVYVLDARGWYYRYSHLHTIDPAIRPGEKIKMGQRLGLLGKEGGSGGWSHLHFDISGRQPSGKWGIIEGYAFLWEAYVQQYHPPLLAVARPHHLSAVGSRVTLDGTRSWSANGRIASYSWTFSDGTKSDGARIDRVYTKPGVYSEILKITDEQGRIDHDFAIVNVLDRSRPESLPPSIHANYYPTFGIRPDDPVHFLVRTFRTTDGKETWDFGDGSPKVEVQSDGNVVPLARDGYAHTVHRFARAGIYLVRVERTNRHGYPASAHLQVRVGME